MKLDIGKQFLVIILIFCYLFNLNDVYSEEIADQRFDNFLSGSVIRTVFQDHRGYLWVGTSDGLNRYDGRSFEEYRNKKKDTTTISDNVIFSIIADRNDLIWIGTFGGGLNQYDYSTNSFHHFYFDGGNGRNLSSDQIWSLALDTAGNIWVGTYGDGIYELEKDKIAIPSSASYRISHYFFHDGEETACNIVTSICFDQNNRGWLGTADGIFMFQPEAKSLHPTHIGENSNSIAQVANSKLYCDFSNFIWVAARNTLDRIYLPIGAPASSKLQVEQFLPSIQRLTSNRSTSVMSFLVDSQRNCWVGFFETGLFRFKYPGDKNHFSPDSITRFSYSSPLGLPSKVIWSVYEHDKNIIWIGTSEGLSKYLVEKEVFKKTDFIDAALRDTTHDIYAAFQDSLGNLWLGGLGRGIWLKTQSGEKHISLQKGSNDAGNNSVTSINKTSAGDILIGLQSGMVVINSTEVKELLNTSLATVPTQYFTNKNSALPGSNITCFQSDRQGRIWIGTNRGLAIYNSVTHIPQAVIQPPDSASTAFYINCLAMEGKDSIWLGTMQGLYLYNKAGNTNSFLVSYKDPDEGQIWSLSYDSINARLWIGSSGGLVCYETNKHQFKRFDNQEKFLQAKIDNLLVDNRGNVWFTGNEGLSIWNTETNQIKQFNRLELFARNQKDCLLQKSQLGQILAVNCNGIFTYSSPGIPSNSVSTPMQITNFKIFNASIFDSLRILGKSLREENTITLCPNQNYITIEFTALDLRDPQVIQYKYKLDGFDKDWHSSGNDHSATYTNLSGRTYTFEVKSTNYDGVWSEKPISFQIVAIPHFYETLWFKISVVLFFTALGGLIFFLIYRSKIQKIIVAQRIRNKIASDLHDDIGSSLNSISVYSEIVKRSLKDANPKTMAAVESMGNTSRQMIDNMSDIVWAINQKNDDFEQILQRMKHFAGELLAEKHIALHFSYDEKVKKIKLPMEKRKSFYLIYKEAINNIYKYSEARNVEVMLNAEGAHLHMTIADDGKGFDEVKTGLGGNGLKNMQARAAEVKAKIEIKSSSGSGTQVLLNMEMK